MLSSDYMRLYQEIGQPLGWTDWSHWTRPQVFEYLQRPGLHLLAMREGDKFIGFAELEERQSGVAELIHFGLLETYRGRGLGGIFLEHVLQYAWEQLHLQTIRLSTLSTDAPQALPNYLKRGFRKERAMVFLERNLEAATPPKASLLAP
jgi:GNAT superfamily N-acetyltransferase